MNGEQDVRRFCVWCPQVFAGIGSQADTLVDRSIIIGLRRKLPAETVERLPFDLHERMARHPPEDRAMGGRQHIRIAAMDEEPSPCGNDRLRDNYTPLWRLAAALGGRWPARIAAAYDTRAGMATMPTSRPASCCFGTSPASSTSGRRQRLQSSSLVVTSSRWKIGRGRNGSRAGP